METRVQLPTPLAHHRAIVFSFLSRQQISAPFFHFVYRIGSAEIRVLENERGNNNAEKRPVIPNPTPLFRRIFF